nr:hypothetical protein CKG001_17550 [Bdellovibrio sp. CKG001]
MLSFVVHYKNKYPKARVEHNEDQLNVYAQDGSLLVALKRGGGGALVDVGEQLGAKDKHDMSPLPKNARVHKLTVDGKIALDEEHADRKPVAVALADLFGGKVPCIPSLKKKGYEFDGDSLLPSEKTAAAADKTIAESVTPSAPQGGADDGEGESLPPAE